MTAPIFTPYSTVKPLMPATMPAWITSELDQQRILSYQIYEQIYWNVPETFKLMARGSENKPIYLPNAKTIVETCNRYTATNMSVNMKSSLVKGAIDADKVVYQDFLDNFFKRERFWSKFAGNKRYGLIRGDWLWYIIADPAKPEGSRISIRPLDPASYFPITDPDDVDKIIGCHIVDQQTDDKGDVKIHKTTYIRPLVAPDRNPGQFVQVEEGIYKLDEWEGIGSKPEKAIRPPQQLPGITSLPVYHIPNFDEPANPFGSSEIRGIERIMAAVNQAISDEELALALEGLGLYVTDAPSPTDDDGNLVGWILGPGRVAEVPAGSFFNRVSGVSSVDSSQAHVASLITHMRESAAIPDVAVGTVDVAIAQSGIALALQFAPILAHTNEKDVSIVEVHAQMLYDLQTQWFPTFEGLTMAGVVLDPVVGDKIPVDRAQKFTELNDALDRQAISTAFYRSEMEKLGYTFPSDIQTQIADDAARVAASVDPFGTRTADELNASSGDATGGVA
jgi:hypothetical protein